MAIMTFFYMFSERRNSPVRHWALDFGDSDPASTAALLQGTWQVWSLVEKYVFLAFLADIGEDDLAAVRPEISSRSHLHSPLNSAETYYRLVGRRLGQSPWRIDQYARLETSCYANLRSAQRTEYTDQSTYRHAPTSPQHPNHNHASPHNRQQAPYILTKATTPR